VSDHFCFSCGAPTVALGQQLVPVCANCKARGLGEGGSPPQWMVRISGAHRTKGPLTKRAVLNGLARQRFGPDDRISGIGGEELAIADHPDFRGCFIPGSADEVAIDGIRQELKRASRRAARARMFLGAGGVALLGLAGAVIWLSATTRFMVIPVAWSEALEAKIDWWRAQSKPVVKREYAPAPSALPHSAWAEAQRPADGPETLHLARRQHWTSPLASLDGVRRGYLQAMALAPIDPVPLAGLIEVDASMLYTRPELLGEISRAVTRLDFLRARGPGVSVANAALALAQSNRLRAKQETEECAVEDPVCALYYGAATLDTTVIDDVIEKYGPSTRALRLLCETAKASEQWAILRTASLSLQRLNPRSPEGHEFMAEFHVALGDWDAAGESAKQAIILGTDRADVHHLQAAVLMGKSQRQAGLSDLFTTVISHPHLAGQANRHVALLQAAQIQVAVGNLEAARMIVDSALEAQAANPAAQVLLADILFKEGRYGAAESVLREVDATTVDTREQAMIHLWASRVYLQMDKQRLGRQELENALRINPSLSAIHEEFVWAATQTKDISGAIRSLQDMILLRPFVGGESDPREGLGLMPPKARRLQQPLLDAMDTDVRYSPERAAARAILNWWTGGPEPILVLGDALEEYPTHLSLQIAMAIAAFEKGEWAIAEKHAGEVVARRPSLAVMHSLRGRAMAKQGLWPAAREPLMRSVKGDAEQEDLLRWAADAFMSNGDQETAAELLMKAYELAPWDSRIRRAQFALNALKK